MQRILKAAREKQLVTCKGAPIKLAADFSKETLQNRGLGTKIQNYENPGSTTKITLSSKAIL